MKKVRITGIVRLANRVRQEISQSVSQERLTQLRENVSNSLQTIDRLLAEAKTGPHALPAPSRKAYQFLSNLDFESIPAEKNHSTNVGPARQIFFRGLRSYLDGILDRLAQIDGQVEGQQIYDSICSASENIERQIQEDDIRPEQIKPQSRDIRGWLAYFAQRRHFDAYGAALRQAHPLFTKALQMKGKLPGQALIHFRPMKGIFRYRGYRNLTLVQLPTPMICFDQEIFHTLAGWAILKGHSKKPVLQAMANESYQKILSEMELLSGITENSAGVFHDLAESFMRVNTTYLEGKMSPPRLVWSQTFTSRKFGHYDQTRNTVMVSSTLDHKDVPEYVVDFIMYHELLHKKLGVIWNRGRRAVHTAAFLRQEQRFPQYHQAKTILNKLAGVKL